MPGFASTTQPYGAYPERRPDTEGRHAARHGQTFLSKREALKPMGGRTRTVLAAVAAAEKRREETGLAARADAIAAIASGLRRAETAQSATIDCLALTRRLVQEHFGFRAHDEQIAGAFHMLGGRLIEMDTGEGKTVTAVFAAAAHALAGRAVHIVTVNDYLAERDARDMGPIYEALGQTVACVKQGMSDIERQAAYRASVVYVTPKQLMFDYLRDRIRLGARASSQLRTELAVLRQGSTGTSSEGFYLQGLQVGIIDEADSVLIDEAVVPLIISRQEIAKDQADVAVNAIAIARQMEEGRDFTLDVQRRDLWLTDPGQTRLEHLARPIGAIFSAKVWREQFCTQALMALHLFRRDRDYIIRNGLIEIVDINTGRTMPDRSWERGLHQMIQSKEGLDITAPNEALARISHQAFFQRYLNLSGMSGTLREVEDEIFDVYGLRTVRIPPHRVSRRVAAGVSIFADTNAKDRRIVARAARLAKAGRSVLIGTATVSCSERISAKLTEAGVSHQLLNARHDEEEARIIASAGSAGTVTVSTNMAGRGTDIRVDEDVREKGGLHVIATERNASRRIDRQLFGRTARQGDPGSFEEILSIEDDLVARHLPAAMSAIAALPIGLRSLTMRLAQSRATRNASKLRVISARQEDAMEKALAFAGRPTKA